MTTPSEAITITRPTSACGRCGAKKTRGATGWCGLTLAHATVSAGVQREQIALCPHCAERLGRWLDQVKR